MIKNTIENEPDLSQCHWIHGFNQSNDSIDVFLLRNKTEYVIR